MTDDCVRILIIEDHPADLAVIEATIAKIQSVSFELHHAELLSTAIEMLTNEIDVILLDLSLPDSNGIDACVKIQQRDSTIPIVVLTGLDDEQMAIEALHRGAQDYLVKGQADSQLLSRAIRYAIERKRIESELQRAHDELEQRVEDRTRELSNTNKELRRVISERERAEEQARIHRDELAHVGRLNTLGEMASNLAHELNQPLTAIVGYARGCLRRLNDHGLDSEQLHDKIVDELEKIAGQAKRGGEIIKRLRRLVSKRESDRVLAQVNDCVRNIALFVGRNAAQSGINVVLELDDDLPSVLIDEIQIEQVLLNLIQNGFDAMSECERDRRSLRICTAMDKQGYIEVKVIDQGTGVDASTLGHIFDPFYSSKDDGLGMGLSISRSIIEAHQGRLSVAPNLDCGLTFRFTIPTEHLDTD